MKNKKSIRLKGYDCGNDGAYFITVCSFKHQLLFGEIYSEKMILNGTGKLISEEWFKTSELRKYISLGEFQVMPNHFHGIIFIHKESEAPMFLPSNEIYSRLILTDYQNKFGSQSNNLASVVRGIKSAVTMEERLTGNGEQLWQPRFHEHIIRNQEELERIENYIRNNPSKWKDDKYFL